MKRRLLTLLILGAACTSACVEREIPLYDVACLRDTQCGDGYCVDGVCSPTPSRPPTVDAGPDIDPDRLRQQTDDAPLELPYPDRLPPIR